jgi:uncharacterized membrane protein HdeD (DUF308 family)
MSYETSTNSPIGITLAREWSTVLFVGIVTLILGVVVLVWPDETLVVLSVLFGIQLLLFGLFRLIHAFSDDVPARGLLGFVGLLGMIAGIAILRHPYDAIAVLATILGVVWIVMGAIDVIGALADSTIGHRFLQGIAGMISVVAGIVVVAWPTPTVTVLAWIGGLYLVIFGLVIVASSWSLRSAANTGAAV